MNPNVCELSSYLDQLYLANDDTLENNESADLSSAAFQDALQMFDLRKQPVSKDFNQFRCFVDNLNLSEFANLLRADEFENLLIWDPRKDVQFVPENMITKMLDAISETDDDKQFKFYWFMCNLVICYELCLIGEIHRALDILESLECHVEELKRNNCNELLFTSMITAIDHVILSSKIIMLKDINLVEAIDLFKTRMPRISEMSKPNLASLRGMKALVYGEYTENKLCVSLAMEAITLDPKNPQWHFLKGKHMARVRRIVDPFSVPSAEETNALETAIKLSDDDCSPFYLFTANAYQDTAFRIYQKAVGTDSVGEVRTKANRLNNTAIDYYKKAVELNPNCSHTLFRVARGFLRFPYHLKDTRYAKTLLEDGLKIAPDNPFGLHQMAIYLDRYENDKEKAREYLEKCASFKVFGACIDLLRLDIEEGRSIDAIGRLNEFYDLFEEKERRLQIISQKLSYYIFIERDIEEACACLFKIIEIDRESKELYEHRSLFFYVRGLICLPDVLLDELNIILRSNDLPKKKRKIYEKLRNDIDECNIPITYPSRIEDLREKILEEAKLLKSFKATGLPNHLFQGPYSDYLKSKNNSVSTNPNKNPVRSNYGTASQGVSNSGGSARYYDKPPQRKTDTNFKNFQSNSQQKYSNECQSYQENKTTTFQRRYENFNRSRSDHEQEHSNKGKNSHRSVAYEEGDMRSEKISGQQEYRQKGTTHPNTFSSKNIKKYSNKNDAYSRPNSKQKYSKKNTKHLIPDDDEKTTYQGNENFNHTRSDYQKECFPERLCEFESNEQYGLCSEEMNAIHPKISNAKRNIHAIGEIVPSCGVNESFEPSGSNSEQKYFQKETSQPNTSSSKSIKKYSDNGEIFGSWWETNKKDEHFGPNSGQEYSRKNTKHTVPDLGNKKTRPRANEKFKLSKTDLQQEHSFEGQNSYESTGPDEQCDSHSENVVYQEKSKPKHKNNYAKQSIRVLDDVEPSCERNDNFNFPQSNPEEKYSGKCLKNVNTKNKKKNKKKQQTKFDDGKSNVTDESCLFPDQLSTPENISIQNNYIKVEEYQDAEELEERDFQIIENPLLPACNDQLVENLKEQTPRSNYCQITTSKSRHQFKETCNNEINRKVKDYKLGGLNIKRDYESLFIHDDDSDLSSDCSDSISDRYNSIPTGSKIDTSQDKIKTRNNLIELQQIQYHLDLGSEDDKIPAEVYEQIEYKMLNDTIETPSRKSDANTYCETQTKRKILKHVTVESIDDDKQLHNQNISSYNDDNETKMVMSMTSKRLDVGSTYKSSNYFKHIFEAKQEGEKYFHLDKPDTKNSSIYPKTSKTENKCDPNSVYHSPKKCSNNQNLNTDQRENRDDSDCKKLFKLKNFGQSCDFLASDDRKTSNLIENKELLNTGNIIKPFGSRLIENTKLRYKERYKKSSQSNKRKNNNINSTEYNFSDAPTDSEVDKKLYRSKFAEISRQCLKLDSSEDEQSSG